MLHAYKATTVGTISHFSADSTHVSAWFVTSLTFGYTKQKNKAAIETSATSTRYIYQGQNIAIDYIPPAVEAVSRDILQTIICQSHLNPFEELSTEGIFIYEMQADLPLNCLFGVDIATHTFLVGLREDELGPYYECL